jgi:hypothetical protein
MVIFFIVTTIVVLGLLAATALVLASASRYSAAM